MHCGSGCEVSASVLRWGDVDAASALALAVEDQDEGEGEGEQGFDLVVGTDLVYFAGAEVTARLCVTIATLLSPHENQTDAAADEVCDAAAAAAAAAAEAAEAAAAGQGKGTGRGQTKALLANHSAVTS